MKHSRRNIVASWLIVLTLFIRVAVTSSAITTTQFQLSALKKVYKTKEKVTFKLTNTSKHTVVVSEFMAEVFRGGHWFECTEDIRRDVSPKGFYAEPLGAGKTVTLRWSTKQDMYLNSPTGRKPITADRKYRFIFYCDKTQATSPVFVVQKPVVHRKRSR